MLEVILRINRSHDPRSSRSEPCQLSRNPVSVSSVKGFAALAFFLVFTVLIGAGLVMGVHGKGWLLLVISSLAYLGFFIKEGCLTSSH